MESLFEAKKIGHLEMKLGEVVKKNGITCNKLSTLTGIKNEVLKRYWEGPSIQKLDAYVISRICECLKCRVCELVDYMPLEEQEKSEEE